MQKTVSGAGQSADDGAKVPLGSLWIGGNLSWLEQLCIKSFLDFGHEVTLYTYEGVTNAPEGTIIADAGPLFPKDEFIVHRASGSSALHSDIFRYHMIVRTGLTWIDCDMLCMQPWVFPSGHVYGWEKPKRLICGAALGFPKDSAALKELIAFCEDPAPIPEWYYDEEKTKLRAARDAGQPVHVSDLPWGIWGPAALTHFLRTTGEESNALPQQAFYPIPFKDRRDVLDPAIDITDRLGGDACYGVHLWNRRLRRRLVTHHGGIPHPDCFVGQAVTRHGIDCAAAPIPDVPPASVLAERAEAEAKAQAEAGALAEAGAKTSRKARRAPKAAAAEAPAPTPEPATPPASEHPAASSDPASSDAAVPEIATVAPSAPAPRAIPPRLLRDAADPAAAAIQSTPPETLADLPVRHPVHKVPKFRRMSDGLEAMLQTQGPWLAPPPEPLQRESILVVTSMKNEAPFILEWIAYNFAIGVDHFLVYTNDCSDNTNAILDRLAAMGIVTRRDNPYAPGGKVKPQHAALRDAPKQRVYKTADWIVTIDLDEFIAVHVGDGSLRDFFRAAHYPNAVSLTWKFFGNGGVIDFEDRPIIEQFTRCAPEVLPDAGLAWGFKTMFNRNTCRFKKLGVHRPTKMVEGKEGDVRWVNGSGRVMPKRLIEKGWRTVQPILGYRLATLNHYALRSADSYLVKRDRGRINHTDQDQGVYYWQRRNYITEDDDRIFTMLPRMNEERARLMADPELADLHHAAVAWHRGRIARLKDDPDYARVYAELVRTAGEDATYFAKLDPTDELKSEEPPPQPVPHD